MGTSDIFDEASQTGAWYSKHLLLETLLPVVASTTAIAPHTHYAIAARRHRTVLHSLRFYHITRLQKQLAILVSSITNRRNRTSNFRDSRKYALIVRVRASTKANPPRNHLSSSGGIRKFLKEYALHTYDALN
jgi:hypothetical protein